MHRNYEESSDDGKKRKAYVNKVGVEKWRCLSLLVKYCLEWGFCVLLRCDGAILILIGHGKVAGGVDLQGKMVVGENERVIGFEK